MQCHIIATSSFFRKVGILLAKKTHPSSACLKVLYLPNILSTNSSEDKLEDIVEDEVTACSIRKKLECLTVVHGSLFLIHLGKGIRQPDIHNDYHPRIRLPTYQQCSGNQDQNSTMFSRGLSIKGLDLVFDFLESKILSQG